MKFYVNLYAEGKTDALQQFIADLSSSLHGEWSRDFESESAVNKISVGDRYVCFVCASTATPRPAVLYFIHDRGSSTLRLANIVPKDQSPLGLGYDGYNAIADEFFRIATPHAHHNGLVFAITEAEQSINDILDETCVQKLQAFSKLANKSSGSSHPADRERWFSFIISAHLNSADLDSSTLSRWLVEEERWSESEASNLATEYDFGRSLLATYHKVNNA